MHYRLFLVFLSLYSSCGFSNEAAWNCQQSKDGKEWVCVGDKKAPANSANETSQNPAQSPKVEGSAIVQPLKGQAPLVAEPRENNSPVEQPKAILAEPDRQNLPAKTTGPVAPEPLEERPVTAEKPGAAPQLLEEKPRPILAGPDSEQIPAENTNQAITEQHLPSGAEARETVTKPANRVHALPIIPEAGEPIPAGAVPEKKPVLNADNRIPGWDCAAGKDEGKWDCNLVGADPGGQPKVIAAENTNLRLLQPAFNSSQEQTFATLKSNLKFDPWQSCGVDAAAAPQFVHEKHLRDVTPLDVKSDYSEIFDNEIGYYLGNVQFHRADQDAQSDSANYDSVSETLDLQGNVFYSEEDLSLHSDTASLRLNSDQARLRDVLFIYPTTPLRGEAKVVYRDDKSLSRYSQVSYTSCQPGNQDWVVHASELKINREQGKGSANNAWVEFKGVPVFYSPYLSFPTDNRRLSGFLAPNFGNTQRSGFNLALPYYWNIAPNYDAVLRPRYLSNRGVLFGGDFRYLSEESKGKLSLEVLPNDRLLNKSRFLGAFKHNTVFSPHLSTNLDLNYVSDRDYFSDLGNALSFNNFSFVRSQADLNYSNNGLSFITRLDNYQTIDRGVLPQNQPYRRLPQITLNFARSFKVAQESFDTSIENEYVYFQHNDAVNGQRFNAKPSISLPIQTDAGFFKPKLSLQYTQYALSKGVLSSDSIARVLPIASIDTGLFFERNLTDSSYVQTFEPRLFYLYIPRKNQSNIPLFDSSTYDFVFNSLFRENRFSGTDRIQDANQITAAFTSRFIDTETGRERLKLNVGEIFYFQNREVTLCGDYLSVLCFQNNPFTQIETNTFSNVVTEVSSQLTEHISTQLGFQWNPQTTDFERNEAAIHFTNKPGEVVNLGFRYRKNPLFPDRRNDIIQSDVSFRWPVYDDWYAVGRWQYSWLFNATRDGFLGVQKETCCWRISILGRRFVNNTIVNNPQAISDINTFVEGVSQTGLFVQFELKGLTGIGQKLDDFFEQSIYGYINPDRKK
ncbi:MAG: LPS assembly protein LptD [Methylococcaceae bacterium]|jgi:LPS-assembly protein